MKPSPRGQSPHLLADAGRGRAWTKAAALPSVLSLLLAACGGDDGGEIAPDEGTVEMTIGRNETLYDALVARGVAHEDIMVLVKACKDPKVVSALNKKGTVAICEGAAEYGMVPEDLLFWIAPLAACPDDDRRGMCRRHADAMVVPSTTASASCPLGLTCELMYMS